MKKTAFIFIGLLLMYPVMLHAQDKKMGDGGTDTDHGNEFGIPMDDLDFTMDDVNDIFGDSDDASNSMPDNFLKEWGNYRNDTKHQKEFENAFKNKFQKYNEYISNLDNYSPYSKCLYLMIKYINELETLKAATEEASECRRTYNLYGMQLMAMMSSTTIMFCTEELYNEIKNFEKGDENAQQMAMSGDFGSFIEDLDKLLEIYDNYQKNENDYSADRKTFDTVTDFEITLMRFFDYLDTVTFEKWGRTYIDLIRVASLIEKYFHPLSLMKDGVAISQQMDRLKPCTGY